jgi:hypothetical protein
MNQPCHVWVDLHCTSKEQRINEPELASVGRIGHLHNDSHTTVVGEKGTACIVHQAIPCGNWSLSGVLRLSKLYM